MGILSPLLDLFFPPRCAGCGRLGTWFGEECQAKILPLELSGFVPLRSRSTLNGIRALGYFEGPLRKAIHALKYSGREPLAEALAQILFQFWQDYPLPAEVVLPVPLHRDRMRQRGYNQAALLAQELGTLLGIAVDTTTLQRVQATPPQVGLSGEKRLKNVAGAFACRDDALWGKAVLLVDDVTTTGATLESCAQALKKVGVASVWGLVLAKER